MLSAGNHKQLIVVTCIERHEFWWSLIRIISHPNCYVYTIQTTTNAGTDQDGGEGEGRKEEEKKESTEKKQKDPSTFNLVEAAQYGVLER